MDDELTPEQKFAAEDAETMVPKALSRGKDLEEIVAELVRLDWPPDNARMLVQRIAEDLRRFHESPDSRKQLVAEARRQFLAGIAITVFGMGITLSTLLAALAGRCLLSL